MATDYKRILIRRGEGALPEDLQTGEFAFKIDTEQLYIGSDGNAIEIAQQEDLTTSINNFDTHAEDTDNPHEVTAAQVGAEPANANIQTHIARTDNPHGVTAAQLNVYTKVESDAQRVPVVTELIEAQFIAGTPEYTNIALDAFDELELVYTSTDTTENGFLPKIDIKRVNKSLFLNAVDPIEIIGTLRHNLTGFTFASYPIEFIEEDELQKIKLSNLVPLEDSNYPTSYEATLKINGIKY